MSDIVKKEYKLPISTFLFIFHVDDIFGMDFCMHFKFRRNNHGGARYRLRKWTRLLEIKS